MAVTVLSKNLPKPVNGCYVIAIRTGDGDTAATVPHSTVSDLRAAYEKQHLQATRLDEKALVFLIATYSDDVSGDNADLVAELTTLDPPQQPKSTVSVSATGRDAVAIKVAKLLASNEAACVAIQKWIDIGIERKQLPATIPYLLKLTFTKEVRADMPIPGSVRPEKYKGQMLFDRADDKPGTESWYVGAIEDFPGYWEKIGTPLRKLQEAEKDAKTRPGQDTIKVLQARKKNLVEAFRDGIELLNMIDMFEDKIPGCHIFFRVIDGVVEPTIQPMRVVFIDETKGELEDGRNYEKYMSCGALRRVELDKVLEKKTIKDRYEAFKPVKTDPDKTVTLSGIQSATDLEVAIGWLAFNEKNGDLKVAFLRRLTMPPAESDPLLLLMAAARTTLENLMDSPKIRTRLTRLLEEQGGAIQPATQVAA